jgi:hypothetical protein
VQGFSTASGMRLSIGEQDIFLKYIHVGIDLRALNGTRCAFLYQAESEAGLSSPRFPNTHYSTI